MESEHEPITLTVKVPFGTDRTVTVDPCITVKDLTESILETSQSNDSRDFPQCIVRGGHILPDASTLKEAGLSNGIVLHLMRRPRDAKRNPGRGRGNTRSRSAAAANSSNSADVSEARHDGEDDDDDDDDDGGEDEGDDDDDNDGHDDDDQDDDNDDSNEDDEDDARFHTEEHHVHTNVIIGQIAVDGRIRFSDAHDMLLSVLHAVGFSTRAVTNAAAVAAAIAVATQSSEERGGASRAVLENAWEGTRSLHELLFDGRNNNESSPINTNEGEERSGQVAAPAAMVSATAENVIEAHESDSRQSTIEQTEESMQEASSGEGRSPERLVTPTQQSQTSAPGPVHQTPRVPPEPLPERPPPSRDGDTALLASGRAANRLLPVLADLMEEAVSRIRRAPLMTDLETRDRIEAAEELTQQLGSVASVVTSVTTLLSTLLPDHDDLRTLTSMNRGSQSGRPVRSRANQQSGTGGSAAIERSALGAHSRNPNVTPGENTEREVPRREEAGTTTRRRPPRDPEHRNDFDIESVSRMIPRAFDMFTREASPGRNGGLRRIRRPRRPRGSDRQASNADFMIRVLSYYFCSLCDTRLPAGSGPPEMRDETAVTILDGLYGTDSTAQPNNIFLRIMHFMMQKLTPRQFHDVCRGDMTQFATVRQDVWGEISRLIRSFPDAVNNSVSLEDFFADLLCNALHDFIHVMESVAEESNESTFEDHFALRRQDFCHHVMHVIRRKVEILANLLAVDRSNEDFSGRMSHWVKGAVGEILLVLALEMGVQWGGLIMILRRALNEIGKRVVGNQFSVIFPYLANLFADRAEELYQTSASRRERELHIHRSSGQVDTNGEVNGCTCGAEDDRQQDMLGEGSTSLDHESSDGAFNDFSHAETDSDMPDLDDQDSFDGSMSDDRHEFSEHNTGEDVMMGISGAMNREAMALDLDDSELNELASELETQSRKNGQGLKTEGDFIDMDLETMADELVAELGSADREVSSDQNKPTIETGRGGSRANPVLSMPGSSLPSSVNRAAFSSAAVPRAMSGGSRSKSSSEFEKLMGSENGRRWQQVVERDQARVIERQYGPLSKGYSGEKRTAQPLNVQRGSELASAAAKKGAKRAKLSSEDASELERMANESGSQYVTEMERAIRSRLLSDPDFCRQRFPRAAERFLPQKL